MGSNYLNYILKTSQRDDKVAKESTLELQYIRIDVASATSIQPPVHMHSEEVFNYDYNAVSPQDLCCIKDIKEWGKRTMEQTKLWHITLEMWQEK